MVTRRFLRLALLGLLGFMVFCLVVMELALHGKQWVRMYQQLSPSLSARTTDHTPSFSSVRTSRPFTLARISENVTTSRGLSGDRSQPPESQTNSSSNLTNSTSASQSSLHVTRYSSVASGNMTTVSSIRTTLKTPPSSASSYLDHCQGAGMPTASGVFSYRAQKLPDGSRPQNCSKCFFSHFAALLQSCQVCNTGGGGKDGTVELVMMILTTHGAAEKRRAIRHTWASITRNNTAHVRHVFVLGRSKNEADMQLVQKEHQRYGDIIVYDFMDAYANLTLKTLTCLHWVLDYCHNARFILKADDDMWVNVPTLLATLKKENATLQTAIGGACRQSAGPIRNKFSKWYASKKDYPQNSYPGFCSGTAYVTSLNVARHVISVSPDVPFFYLEDVYMALCIKKLGPPFHLHGLGGFFHGGAHPCVLRGSGTISVHQVKPSRLITIWETKCP